MSVSQSAALAKLANKFIVIEGLEGAGKSTAIGYVKEWLAQVDMPSEKIVYTREPGGTVLAEKMRDIVKMEVVGETLNDKAELLMLYAARVQLVEHMIKPALANGCVVIGDRHNYSSMAYQGGGRGIDLELITQIKQLVLGDFKADLTLFLDVEPEVGLNRARGRGELDRIERQAIDFFQRTRSVFSALVKEDENAFTIDAGQTPERVKNAIFAQLDNWLESLI